MTRPGLATTLAQALRRRRGAHRAPGPDDAGFTLIEMVIVIVILSVIIVPISGAMIIALNTVNASSERLSVSGDRGVADVYVTRDVASASSAQVGGDSPCTGAATVLVLEWGEISAAGTPPTTIATTAEADYVLQQVNGAYPAMDQLVRLFYTGSPCTLQSSTVVAYDLKAKNSAASATVSNGTVTLSLVDLTKASYQIQAQERS